MNEEQPDQAFWDLADRFIELANQHLDETPPGKVSAALLYAAARFNAFIAAGAEGDLAEEKQTALKYFTGQYRKMLEENLDDYIANPLEGTGGD